MSGQNRRPVTGGGRSTATARQIPAVPFRLSCYKCRKPCVMKSMFCRCPCSCVVCYQCADEQFTKLERTDCPACKKVIDPCAVLAFDVGKPSKPDSALEASLQRVFMPLPKTPNGLLTYDGMKRRVLSNIEHMKVEVDFLLTNVMRANMNQFRNGDGMRKQLQSQQAQLKSQQAEIQALQHKHHQEIGLRDRRIAELGDELSEQQELVKKFRLSMSSSSSRTSFGSSGRGGQVDRQQSAGPRMTNKPFDRPHSRVAVPLPRHGDYVDTGYHNTNLAGHPHDFDERSQASSLMSGGIRQGLNSQSTFSTRRGPPTHGDQPRLSKRRRVSDGNSYDHGHRRSSPGDNYQGSASYGGSGYHH